MLAAAATVAVAAVPAVVADVVTPDNIKVLELREYFGDGEFGNFMSVYARGHHSPQVFIDHIDMDSLMSLLDVDDAGDEDEDALLISRAEAELPSRVRHGYAMLSNHNPEWDDDEQGDDDEWFIECPATAEGAFPVTMIEV